MLSGNLNVGVFMFCLENVSSDFVMSAEWVRLAVTANMADQSIEPR